MAGALLGGCGDGASTVKGNPIQEAEEPPTPKALAMRAFLKRNYSKERWYPNLRRVNVDHGIAAASTYLKFHPRQNHRDATSVCAALLASKLVPKGVVFWGRSETMECTAKEKRAKH